jgi:hypothetical protein
MKTHPAISTTIDRGVHAPVDGKIKSQEEVCLN